MAHKKKKKAPKKKKSRKKARAKKRTPSKKKKRKPPSGGLDLKRISKMWNAAGKPGTWLGFIKANKHMRVGGGGGGGGGGSGGGGSGGAKVKQDGVYSWSVVNRDGHTVATKLSHGDALREKRALDRIDRRSSSGSGLADVF